MLHLCTLLNLCIECHNCAFSVTPVQTVYTCVLECYTCVLKHYASVLVLYVSVPSVRHLTKYNTPVCQVAFLGLVCECCFPVLLTSMHALKWLDVLSRYFITSLNYKLLKTSWHNHKSLDGCVGTSMCIF